MAYKPPNRRLVRLRQSLDHARHGICKSGHNLASRFRRVEGTVSHSHLGRGVRAAIEGPRERKSHMILGHVVDVDRQSNDRGSARKGVFLEPETSLGSTADEAAHPPTDEASDRGLASWNRGSDEDESDRQMGRTSSSRFHEDSGLESDQRQQHRYARHRYSTLVDSVSQQRPRERLPRFVLYGNSENHGKLGIPDPSTVRGFNHYNIAFWTTKYGPSDACKRWADGTREERQARKKQYAEAGIKLMVSLFGADDQPQTLSTKKGRTAKALAGEIAAFVKQNDFDGCDVDYEEFELFEHGKGAPWIIDFHKALRSHLPSPRYIISHAPVAPWFDEKSYKGCSYIDIYHSVSASIDFLNIQFYNQGPNAYTTPSKLLWRAGSTYPGTAIFQIAQKGRIPLNKLLIGKPAIESDANNGYMSKRVLADSVVKAKKHGWNAGLMFWGYPHIDGHGLDRIRTLANDW